MQNQEPIPYEAGQDPPASPERMSPPAISIRGLTKRYGPLTALNDLNLEVSRGEIFGFLGLNGAGKTTAIRLLLDLLVASAKASNALRVRAESVEELVEWSLDRMMPHEAPRARARQTRLPSSRAWPNPPIAPREFHGAEE